MIKLIFLYILIVLTLLCKRNDESNNNGSIDSSSNNLKPIKAITKTTTDNEIKDSLILDSIFTDFASVLLGRTKKELTELNDRLKKTFFPLDSSKISGTNSNWLSIVGVYLPGGDSDSVFINDSIAELWIKKNGKKNKFKETKFPDNKIVDNIRNKIKSLSIN